MKALVGINTFTSPCLSLSYLFTSSPSTPLKCLQFTSHFPLPILYKQQSQSTLRIVNPSLLSSFTLLPSLSYTYLLKHVFRPSPHHMVSREPNRQPQTEKHPSNRQLLFLVAKEKNLITYQHGADDFYIDIDHNNRQQQVSGQEQDQYQNKIQRPEQKQEQNHDSQTPTQSRHSRYTTPFLFPSLLSPLISPLFALPPRTSPRNFTS